MKIKQNHSGFTLIELLIAIAIIGIGSVFLLVNFRGQEKQRELKNEASLVLDGVKKVQTMALSGAKVGDSQPAVYGFAVSPCPINCFFVLTVDGQEFERTALNRAVVDLPSDLAVNFQPPRGQMEISGGADEAVIKLKSDSNSVDNFCVYLNAVSGRLEIQNCN